MSKRIGSLAALVTTLMAASPVLLIRKHPPDRRAVKR